MSSQHAMADEDDFGVDVECDASGVWIRSES